MDADDANDKVKWENNINKKQHSALVKHLFSSFCCKTDVVLVLCCCLANEKNARICIPIGLCIYLQDFHCIEELVNRILDKIEFVEASMELGERLEGINVVYLVQV